MKDLKYSEILTRNRALGQSLETKPYRIAVLSNIVVAQLVDILEYSLRSCGINARVICGDFDNVVQDSARFSDMDAVVIFCETASLVEDLHVRSYSMESVDLAALAERVRGEVALVLANLRHVPLVLFNRFSSLLFGADELRDTPLDSLRSQLNDCLAGLAGPNCLPVDIDHVLAKVGLAASVDFRQFQSSKALYSIAFLRAYAEHVAPAFSAIAGKMRKVLVLDCDNTLWGGVLGEDGEGQLKMSDLTRPGRAYREVQEIARGLRKEGALLALCSKNNAEDVYHVLKTHPDMLLRESDFVAIKVNWQDKVTNLRALAGELNLGLDSFVFIDDSGFEIGLVEQELPDVAVVKVPGQLSEYPALMRQVRRLFFSLSRTPEDARKTAMYREEAVRRRTEEQFSSIEDYLRHLDLKLHLRWNQGIPVERAAQLTQKTNQFNLTTRRYTEADVNRFLSDRKHALATFSASDRFGDYGVTGLVILEFPSGSSAASVDTFLMSCRVLGRNLDKVLFDQLILFLKGRGVARLSAEYLRTSKNDQVSSLYDSLGLRLVTNDDRRKVYELAVDEYQASGIDYIEVSTNAC